MRLTTFLSFDEYQALNNEAKLKGFYYQDRRLFTPGMGWYEPWYWDPEGIWKDRPQDRQLKRWNDPFLSIHYWRDWADKRAPICVVGPNGEHWEIDRKSSNGNGWEVTGEWPNITCKPSIVLTGYHGHLTNGEFGPDLEGRGPNGISRS